MGTFISYIGNVDIPEDKKDEYYKNLEKLYQLGGMMSFDKVSLCEKEINLIEPVKIVEGECGFHYNYFEDDVWESAGFNISQNEQWSGKIGSNEFNFVMCAGYMLTELYSDVPGYVEYNGDILDCEEPIQWINYILDKDFSAEKRFDLWSLCEAYIFERLENGYGAAEVKLDEIFDFVPKSMQEYMGGTELADIFYITEGSSSITGDAMPGSYAYQILELRKILELFYEQEPEEGRNIIWDLVCKPIEERRCINGTEYDLLAEISTRIPARVFVYLSAEILELSFWKEWAKIHNEVYRDEVAQQYVRDDVWNDRKKYRTLSLGKMKTSEYLRNNGYFTFYGTPEEIRHKGNYYISDDDLMYWWDGSSSIQLSDTMLKTISKWKQDYDEIYSKITVDESSEFKMLMNLLDVLEKAEKQYKRIFSFKNMFYEFIDNANEAKYVAAVRLFEKIVEENKETGAIIKKARGSWDLTSKNVTFNEGRVTIKRFLSLMANSKLRKIYFDF